MPGPKEPFASPLAWWSTIQGAVAEGKNMAGIWDDVKAYAAEQGITWGPDMFGYVNQLAAAGKAVRESSATLGKATPGDAITGNMIAALPYGRPATDRGLLSQWHVTVNQTVARGGVIESSSLVMMYTGTLPPTVADLYADAEASAAAWALKYGHEVLSIDSLSIGEV